jgi:NADH-quinone oxidoreductase subunit H
MFIFIIKFILFFVPLLIAIAFLTLLERKIIASFQQRKGPNVVGFLGLLQPLADGIKLFLKESTFPSFISILLFLLAPLITFSCAIAL